MAVFDLTEIQANYILDMPLRRLTKFSKLELDKEKDELQRTIEELDAILGDEHAAAEGRRPTSWPRSPRPTARPRRTVLLESAGQRHRRRAAPLEVADDPCWVLLSSTGLLARTDHRRAARAPAAPAPTTT